MRLNIAGTEKQVPDGTTVEALLELEQVEMPQYVTVTVNDDFIPSEDRAAILLKDGDTVEFLYFMGGGC